MTKIVTLRPVKVKKIRSYTTDENQNVFLRLSTIFEDKEEEGWAHIVPDNEGARWVIKLALEAKTKDIPAYVYGEQFHYTYSSGNGGETRLKILEFGLE